MFAVFFLKKIVVWCVLSSFIILCAGCASNSKTDLNLVVNEQVKVQQDAVKINPSNIDATLQPENMTELKSSQAKFKKIYSKYNASSESLPKVQKQNGIDTKQFLANNRNIIEQYQKIHKSLGQQPARFIEGECLDGLRNTALRGKHWKPIAHKKAKMPIPYSTAQIRSYFYNRPHSTSISKLNSLHASGRSTLNFGRNIPRSSTKLLNHERILTTISTGPCAPKTLFLTKSSSFNPSQSEKKSQFNHLIAQAAQRHQVDEKLVHAVIQTESAYNANATSSAGAVGLMQLMPGTAKQYGVTNRNDPTQNINGGTRYLRYLLDLFNSNMDLAVAAYNAGEHTVMKYNNSIPPYPETRNYVRQVLSLYNR